jgi:hypothetical protein
MSGESENTGVVRPRLAAIARIVVLGIPLVGTGCIVLPVPSVTPCQQTGIIDDTTLESLAGLDQEGVRERLGWPDYSGPRGRSHLMVYEGAKHYSTDVFFAVAAGYTAAGGTIDGDCGTSKVMYCYVVELDENRIVEDHNVIARSPGALAKRDSSEETLEAIANCSEAVWKPHERKQVVTKQEAESVAKASQPEAGAREDDTGSTIEHAE